MRALICAIIGVLFLTTANAAEFSIQTTGFANNAKFPTLYTCDGTNTRPGIVWSNPPSNTVTYALILYSPDATIRTPFYNWVLFNIPNTVTEIKENADLPEGSVLGNNSLGEAKYNGPCPPDARLHHYIFRIYALDTKLYLPEGSEPEDVLAGIKNHIIKQAETCAVYSH